MDPASLPSALNPAQPPCLWLTCDILVFMEREAKFLMVIDVGKMSCLNMLQLDLPPTLHSLPPGPQFILITQSKLSRMERLPAVSHKLLIVLWSWIVAFYRPEMVKGTFATGVGHGIFSGNANGFQGPSLFIPDICDVVCVYRRIETYTPPFLYLFVFFLQFCTIPQLILCIDTFQWPDPYSLVSYQAMKAAEQISGLYYHSSYTWWYTPSSCSFKTLSSHIGWKEKGQMAIEKLCTGLFQKRPKRPPQ